MPKGVASEEKVDRLTEKQEAFVRAYFETGNQAEAYRQAFDVAENARDSWIYVEACQLMDRPKIARRLNELREQAARLSIYTRERVLEELEAARVAAMGAETPQSSAAVAAIMGKAKLLGFDRPSRVEITGKDGGAIQHSVSAKDLTDDELARLALGGSNGASAS